MKIFIIESEMSTVKILQKIIEDKKLGDFVGYSKNGLDALQKIINLQPDIVLVGLLMTGKDGVSLAGDIKEMAPAAEVIMISEVSSSHTNEIANKTGVAHYVCKPINALEIETMMFKVRQKINKSCKLELIKEEHNTCVHLRDDYSRRNSYYILLMKNMLHKVVSLLY